MSTQIQRRRGTTAEHASFTGALGETTVDTDKDTVVVHDGTTVGGHPLMRENGSNSALALGSQGTPSLKFTGDTNTGIYSPGADQVAISTGGSGRLRVSSTGTVEIVGAGTIGSTQAVSFNGSAPVNSLVIDSSGRLGVGTSSPGDVLHVEGTIRTSSSSSNAQFANNFLRSNQAGTFYFDQNSGSQDFAFRVSNVTNLDTTAMTIKSSGRVGIGTSSASTNVEINAALDTGASLGLNEGQLSIGREANSGGAIRIGYDTTNNFGFISPGRVGVSWDNLILNAGGGRVGIGSTPSFKLDVNTGSNDRIRIVDSASATLELERTGAKSYLIQSTGDSGLRVYDEDAGSERARIDSSGRLLVGTSTSRGVGPAGFHAVQIEGVGYNQSSLSIVNNENSFQPAYLTLGKSRGTSIGSNTVVQNGDVVGNIDFAAADGSDITSYAARISAEIDGTPGNNDTPGRLLFSTTRDGQSSPTEAMRITQAGKLILNDTSTAFSARFGITANLTNDNGLLIKNSVAQGSGQNFIAFVNSTNNDAGAIVHNGTGTVNYATSSDYRLKENVVPINDGITRLQQLKPSRFNFIADAGRIVDGFLAHEVQDIVPEAVTGDKDALNENGSIKAQGIDQSKLVPLLTAALQEAVAKIESLEARLTAAGI